VFSPFISFSLSLSLSLPSSVSGNAADSAVYTYLMNRRGRNVHRHEIRFIENYSALPMRCRRVPQTMRSRNFVRVANSRYKFADDHARARKVRTRRSRASEMRERRMREKSVSSFVIVGPMWRTEDANCR